MRRLLATLAFAVVIALPAQAADEKPKDTEKAAATRKAVDTVKITVDWKDALIQDVVKEIGEALEEKGKVKATVKADSILSGLTLNMKVSYSAKDKTIAEVLDELGKKYGLGYVVCSGPVYKKKIKNADGMLLLTKGAERGYPSKD